MDHAVVGLVQSAERGALLAALGGTPLIGSLSDLAVLRRAASESEGMIHAAFGLDLSRIAELAAEDRIEIGTFGEVFAGSKRPIIVTDGFLHRTGEKAREVDRPGVIAAFPRVSQQTAFALADRGLHASVVRNPRSVHGKGERHGFVSMLAAVARQKSFSAHIADGRNLWPVVHRLDCARVYQPALEGGGRGEAYHAVAEEGVPFREIAQAIGRQLGVPAHSIEAADAQAHFGPLATWV